MKKARRILSLSLAMVMTATALVGCGGNTDTGGSGSGAEIQVNFWSAPEQYNYDIWSKYAQKFNDAGIKVGSSPVKVVVQQMPAQPSSEAGIQNAIATGSVPAISENINRSFGATLANSEAVYDLSKEDWFKAIVDERKIGDVMDGWAVNGAQYVLPLYVNPIGFSYNSKALKSLGVTKVPETTAEFSDLLAKYSSNKDTLNTAGITHFMYRYELSRPDNWWERWFDFEALYDSFSQGKSYVDGSKLTIDKAAAKKVFDFYGAMGSSLLTGEIPKIWQLDTVPVVVGAGLPWDITANKAAGKVYGLDGDYVFGPMLVEKSGDTPYTFADSKGLVLYKNKNISEDQHKGAIEFLKFVFTGAGKDTFDVDWLDLTAMLPVRGDLETNATLKDYFTKNPEIKAVSTFVANGIPCMANEKMSDILTSLGESGLTPYITEKVSKAGINQTPDSSSYVDAAISAMKQAGSLE